MWKYGIAVMAAFTLLVVVFSSRMKPELSSAYSQLELVEEDCRKALEDAQPGAEKRAMRQFCESAIEGAKQRIKNAR